MSQQSEPYNPFRQATFLLSVNHLRQLPEDSGLEVAFAGRSNAGKSSALNVITDNNAPGAGEQDPGAHPDDQIPGLAGLGIDPAKLMALAATMAKDALDSGSPGNNPRVPRADEIV